MCDRLDSLIVVAARKFAVNVYKFIRFRASFILLGFSRFGDARPNITCTMRRASTQWCAPRVGLYIGMFARIIVARPALDTFLSHPDFKKRLKPLIAQPSSLLLYAILRCLASRSISHFFRCMREWVYLTLTRKRGHTRSAADFLIYGSLFHSQFFTRRYDVALYYDECALILLVVHVWKV